MKLPKIWVAAAAMVALTGAAQAALVNRGGGMIYDTTRNITWLADMNYASTSGHSLRLRRFEGFESFSGVWGR